MSDRIECRHHGRDFTAGEMALLRRLIAGPPALNRHSLSKEFCRRIGWFKPDGGLKDMMGASPCSPCTGTASFVLPPPKWRQNRPRPIVFGQDTEPPLFPPPTTLDEIRSPRRTACRITVMAPVTRSRLRSRWPIFDILPSLGLPPVVCCRGTG